MSGLVSISHCCIGSYELTFNRDVGSCAWIVPRSVSFGVNDANNDVELTAFGLKSFANPPLNPNVVEVIADVSGLSTDQAFSLAVIC
jgi:hypothetical protein